MKNLKKITISLIIAIVTFSSLNIAYTFVANSFYSPSFFLAKNSYHASMNVYFNDKIEKLNDLMAEDDFYNNPDFNSPDFIEEMEVSAVCGENNVSSYCVSMGALDIYMDYVDELSELFDTVEINEEETVLLEDVYNAVYERNAAINDEIDLARQTLEATVSAYNEYRLARPMHEEYQRMIDNLKRYQYALRYVARISETLPGKFIDATSAYCK